MIELKQIYAGRAHRVPPIQGPVGWGTWNDLVWEERALPEGLVTNTLTAHDKKPFTSTSPLFLQVEDAGHHPQTFDVFIWIYVQDHCAYPSLEAVKAGSPTGWRGL